MGPTFSFSLTSRVHADAPALWLHMSRMSGVNYELMPYVRMTFPKDKDDLNDLAEKNPSAFVPGADVFTSYLVADYLLLVPPRVNCGLTHRYVKHPDMPTS